MDLPRQADTSMGAHQSAEPSANSMSFRTTDLPSTIKVTTRFGAPLRMGRCK